MCFWDATSHSLEQTNSMIDRLPHTILEKNSIIEEEKFSHNPESAQRFKQVGSILQS